TGVQTCALPILLRPGTAGAAVRDVRGRARPRRDPGARQGGDAVRTGAAAARAGGAARADLPPGGGRMSAAAPRVTIVKVAEWAVARADGVIVTLGLGSCVARSEERRVGKECRSRGSVYT